MKTLKILTIIIASICPFAVLAQQAAPADTLLNHLTGKWLLEGTIMGKAIQHDITAEWVLGSQYIELKETARDKRPDGQPSYDAIVFISYNKVTNQYDCLWLDNTEPTDFDPKVIAHGTPKTNTIALLFNAGGNSLFHTMLSFMPKENKWHWKMESDDNGKMELFADAQMVKE